MVSTQLVSIVNSAYGSAAIATTELVYPDMHFIKYIALYPYGCPWTIRYVPFSKVTESVSVVIVTSCVITYLFTGAFLLFEFSEPN